MAETMMAVILTEKAAKRDRFDHRAAGTRQGRGPAAWASRAAGALALLWPDLTGDREGDRRGFEQHGIKVVCDPKSLLYLNGTTVDFKDERWVGACVQQPERVDNLRLRVELGLSTGHNRSRPALRLRGCVLGFRWLLSGLFGTLRQLGRGPEAHTRVLTWIVDEPCTNATGNDVGLRPPSDSLGLPR